MTNNQMIREPRWVRQTPPKKKRPPVDPMMPAIKGLTKKQLEKSLNNKFK